MTVNRFPTITPYLLYEDAASAIDWLSRALGFRERAKDLSADGRVTHAEMEFPQDGVIMLGRPGAHYKNPKDPEGHRWYFASKIASA